MLPTGQNYLASFFGVMLAGGIPVPIYPPARLAQIDDHLRRHAHILANAEAVFIVTVAQAKGVAALLRTDCLLYTSGRKDLRGLLHVAASRHDGAAGAESQLLHQDR